MTWRGLNRDWRRKSIGVFEDFYVYTWLSYSRSISAKASVKAIWSLGEGIVKTKREVKQEGIGRITKGTKCYLPLGRRGI